MIQLRVLGAPGARMPTTDDMFNDFQRNAFNRLIQTDSLCVIEGIKDGKPVVCLCLGADECGPDGRAVAFPIAIVMDGTEEITVPGAEVKRLLLSELHAQDKN